MSRIKLKIDKPFYVGFSVLELSKLHMMRFHYEYIKPKYGNRAELLFTDTDSLMYEIQTDNIYADMYKSRAKYFDLTNFPTDTNNPLSQYRCTDNNKVVGMMKDEIIENSEGY